MRLKTWRWALIPALLTSLLFPAAAWSIDDLAIAPNGKIIVAGHDGGYPDRGQFKVAKVMPTGSLATRFGGDAVITPRGGQAAAITSEGKVVVVGTNRGDILIYRYRRNGSLDRTFSRRGKNGVARLKGGRGAASGDDVVVRPNGEIFVGANWYCHGRGCGYTQSYMQLLRVNGHGRLLHFEGIDGGEVTGMDLAPHRKILEVGIGTESESALAARYTRRARLDDRGFGHGGWTYFSGSAYYGPADVVAQADGSAVTAMAHGLTRLTPKGYSDRSFGGNGLAICKGSSPAPPFGHRESLNAVEVQPDQRLVAAGRGCGLVRFTSDGLLDSPFGVAGQVALPVTDPNARTDVALQRDGRIVVAWWDENLPGFTLARFLSDGSADSSFGVAGMTSVRVSRR